MEKIKINQPSDLDYYSREAYNTLRTNILFCGADIKTILFTSCAPGRGQDRDRVAARLLHGGSR